MLAIGMIMYQILTNKVATMSEHLLTITGGRGRVGTEEVAGLCAGVMTCVLVAALVISIAGWIPTQALSLTYGRPILNL